MDDRVDDDAPNGSFENIERTPRPSNPHHDYVVVDVQRNGTVALDAEQKRITEFIVLGEIEDLHPKASRAIKDGPHSAHAARAEDAHESFGDVPVRQGRDTPHGHAHGQNDEDNVMHNCYVAHIQFFRKARLVLFQSVND